MKKYRRFRTAVVRAVLAIVATAVLFFGISWLTEYHPAPVETLYRSAQPDTLPDTLTLVSWNIGYGGLGDNMDFFYDGGTRVRDSRGRTAANLAQIILMLQKIDADILLLQEVDSSSRRTYRIDQVRLIEEAFPGYTACFAYNYKAWWVPIPVLNPIGGVRSGMMTLSRFKPLDAERFQYPSAFAFPTRMFNLKRGLLCTRFIGPAGDTVMIGNTHNTAYDTGGMRYTESVFLADLLSDMDSAGIRSVTGGDWNQYPPDYIPTAAELSNPCFVPQEIDGKLFARVGQFVYDKQNPSLRYLDRPEKPEAPADSADRPVRTLTDFFLVSPGIEVLSVETLPLGFRNSDHNPVVLKIALKQRQNRR